MIAVLVLSLYEGQAFVITYEFLLLLIDPVIIL